MQRAPVVGRTAELEVLEGALADARAGRGGIVLLVGEPGIGKSTLVEEVARIASTAGDADVAFGRAWEAGGAPAFWPWTQVLRTVTAPSSSPHVAHVRGDSTASMPVTAEDRFLLFDAVTRHLFAAAAVRPLVILLEDLHAADESSLHLLAFVAGQLRRSPVLVVGTYRDVEARLTEGAGALLDRVARSARVLRPARLTQDDVHALARANGIEEADASAIYRRSEGNPLFVVELLRVLPTRGAAAIPASVRTAIREHLASLPAALAPTLQAAAVIGREMQSAVVAAISGASLGAVQEQLAHAVTLGILVERGVGRFAFAHGLIAETLHDDLPAAQRQQLHLAVADQLESEPAAPIAEIAHHLLDAGPDHAERAAVAVCKAAERARRQLAFEPAAQLIERSLATAPTTNRLTRFELVRLLAEVRILGGDDARGAEAAREAAELARSLGSGELLARAALTAGLIYSFGHIDHVLVQLLEEALAELPAGDHPLRARMMARLAAALTPAQHAAHPMQLARDSIDMARRLGDDRTKLDVMHAAVSALLPFAPAAERRALNLEVSVLAARFEEPLIEMRSLMRLTFDHFELADLAGIEMYQRAYDDCVERLRLPRARWPSPMFRAMLALIQGRFDDQRDAFAEAERLALEAGDRIWETTRVGHIMTTCAIRRDRETIENMRGAFSTFASFRDRLQFEWFSALVHVWLGEFDSARAITARFPVGRDILDRHLPAVACWAAEIAWRLHDRTIAADLYPWVSKEATPLPAIHNQGFGISSPMAGAAMLLAATLGDLDAARRHYESGLRTVRAVGARALEARLSHDFAQITPDPTEARELGASARAVADSLGINLPPFEPATAPAAVVGAPLALQLRCEGEYWVIEGHGAACRLKASRGIEMLAKLVDEPGREVHVLDLIGAELVDAGDAGEVLDADAKRAYRARMIELREELEAAEARSDAARADRANAELEALAAELSRATGLGKRDRRTGKAAERARINVQRRITDAIKRIADAHVELGRHLEAAVRTGTYCSYAPERNRRTR